MKLELSALKSIGISLMVVSVLRWMGADEFIIGSANTFTFFACMYFFKQIKFTK